LEAIILRTLEKAPENRFADGQAVLQALEKIEESSLAGIS
jgi:hypothetical protein